MTKAMEVASRIINAVSSTSGAMSAGIGHPAKVRERAATTRQMATLLLMDVFEGNQNEDVVLRAKYFDQEFGDGDRMIEQYLSERAFRRTEIA